MGEVPGAGRACQRLEPGNVTDNKCCSGPKRASDSDGVTDGVHRAGEDGNPIKAEASQVVQQLESEKIRTYLGTFRATSPLSSSTVGWNRGSPGTLT